MSSSQALEHEALKIAYRDTFGEWRAFANAKAILVRNELTQLMTREVRAGTAITILVDLSGSMRGQRILMCLTAIQTFGIMIEALGIKFEILGFTTSMWRGGRPREQWLRDGKPAWPGRLNEILHLVIASSGNNTESVRLADFPTLLRPDLLKENIDGEAVSWAAERLMLNDSRHRQLIIISDGAPMDDATFLANGGALLHAHLVETVGAIQRSGDIDIAAIGVDCVPNLCYGNRTKTSSADELLESLFSIARSISSSATGRSNLAKGCLN